VAGTIGNRQPDGSYAITPTPIGPIPVFMIHGQQDTSVLYDGGTDVIPELDVLPVADAVSFWTEANGCTGTPMNQVSLDGNILIEGYTDCADGSEVRLVTIVNGGHQWPTLESQTKFPASEAIWDFFSRHSK
jgi:poly(3-hydroxybutyrate) depolymerase